MNLEKAKEKILNQNGRVFERDIISKPDNEKLFAICIDSDDKNLLVPLKVYEVVLSRNGYVGIADEKGEKAIYPSEYFVFLELSNKTSKLLEKTLALA